MYGDIKVEIRKPRKSGDLSEEYELNGESGCVDWGGLQFHWLSPGQNRRTAKAVLQ